MKHLLTLFAALLLGFGFAQEVSVTDTTGAEITLAAPAQRVVTIDGAAYLGVAQLGVVQVGAAVWEGLRTDDTLHPDGESIPNVGTDGSTPDPELVAGVEPDLIIGWVNEHRPMLEEIAPYYAFAGLTGIESYVDAFRDLGALLGRDAMAEEIIANYEDRVAAYSALVPEKPTVLGLYGDIENAKFWLVQGEHPGCLVVATVLSCPWSLPLNGQAGTETVLELDPDVILLNVFPAENALAALQNDPLWNELRAVKEGRVITPPSPAAWNADSVAGFATFLDNSVPLILPETFPNGPLTDAEVAAAVEE